MTSLDWTDPAEAPLRVDVTCVDTYFADLRDRYSYTFQVTGTDSRFRVYDRRAYRFDIGGAYHLHLSDPANPPLLLPVEDIELLHTTLHNAARRWREAIAEADAGARQPARPPAEAPPGYVSAEPTPAGYRAAGQRFRDELVRVEHLIAVLDAHLRTRPANHDTDTGDASRGDAADSTGGDGSRGDEPEEGR